MKFNCVLKGGLVFTFFLILAGSCTIPFYFESPSMFYKFGMDKTLLRTGKILGILAGVLIIFQPLYIARVSFLDKVFGQDKLLVFHRRFSFLLLFLVVLHPVFILWAENFTFFPMEMRYWPAFLGVGLFFLVIFMVGLSYYRARLGMNWNTWIVGHKIMAPLVLAGVWVHVLKVSKSFETGLPNILIWGAAFIILFLLFKKWILQPGFLSVKYKVTSVKAGAKDSWVLDITSASNRKIEFSPGQFAYITPIGKNIDKEEHPFTIASAPGEKAKLQFVIRACGDFTRQIPQLEPDDFIRVDGPYGRFSHIFIDEQSPLIMIAGGIGITPMLSMLRSMAEAGNKRKILLVWSNKTQNHILFEKEFEHFTDRLQNLHIQHILTRNPGVQDARQISGRIDLQTLRPLLHGFPPDTHVFLCGPAKMVSAVKKMLNAFGFSSRRVYTESFML